MDVNSLAGIIESKLAVQFGDTIQKMEIQYDIPIFHVQKDRIIDVLRFLKEDKEMGFHFLTLLGAVHYPQNEGGELAVVYHLHNMPENKRIRIKTFLPISNPMIPTATTLWATANWMERETYDFFGVIFEGHPDLRRILNMDEMNYFPLRKEYPLEDQSRDDKNDAMFGR